MFKNNFGKPFEKGNQFGHGRKPGSRNRLQKGFLDALLREWDQHGEGALRILRVEKPEVFCRIVADLVPKQEEVETTGQQIIKVMTAVPRSELDGGYPSARTARRSKPMSRRGFPHRRAKDRRQRLMLCRIPKPT